MEERFELVKGRIREMQQEMDVPERFCGFFHEMTSYLNYVLTLHEKIREGWLEHAALSELQKNNEELYGRILPGAYETSTRIRPMRCVCSRRSTEGFFPFWQQRCGGSLSMPMRTASLI